MDIRHMTMTSRAGHVKPTITVGVPGGSEYGGLRGARGALDM